MVHGSPPTPGYATTRLVSPHSGRRRPPFWLALLAAALNALTPLAASARSGAMALPMELCSAATPAGSGDAIQVPAQPAPAEHAAHHPHCGACPAGGLSLPAADGAGLLFGPELAGTAAFLPREAARTETSRYLPSRPRGPPAILLG
jgi:hypothetical protein